jgi:PAS domain S-box-containing protein
MDAETTKGPAFTNAGQDLELLKAALDASGSGIVITNNRLHDNPIIYCNKAFLKMTGYKPEEIIGHNCRFMQSNDRDQPERTKLKDAVTKGEEVSVEIRNYKRNGDLFWNELYISPVRSSNGEVTHFVGVQHDITQRKQTEQDLAQQRNQFEKKTNKRAESLKQTLEYLDSIIQTVRESLLVLDANYKVLTVNEHFLRTFKATRAETLGNRLFELGNGQWNIPALKDLLEKILPTSNPVLDFKVDHDFPRIGRKIMLLNAHQVELAGAYKDRILLAIEDVTDRSSVEQRKDDFLSIASHELKTPLTTIKGYVQVLERLLHPESSDKVKEVVKKTEIQLDRLNRLVAELLDVSRIQSGKLEIHREPFNFTEMVHDAVQGIQSTTSTHRIDVKGTAVDSFCGDESQLTQVVSNLVNNAIKYSPKADLVQVHLSAMGDFLKFSVTDQGLGISKDDQQKVFERFYRADKIQKYFPGMGIGLYISEQIIKQHGGVLWVDSEESKGSTFSFTLPLIHKTDES